MTPSAPRSPPAAGDRLTPVAFAAVVAEGRLASGAAETTYAFGKMSLRAFLDGLAAPGFEQALALAKPA